MSVISTALRHLMAAGVTGDALISAVEEMEAALRPARSTNAERQQRWRDAQKAKRAEAEAAENVTRNVTCVTKRNAVTIEPAPSPPPFLSPQTPQTNPPPHPHPEGLDAYTRGLILDIALSVIIAGCAGKIAAGKPAKRRWPKDMPPPPGVSEDQWAGYVAHRAAKRVSITHRAYHLLVGKLAKLSSDLWPPGLIVDTMVDRGWTSFELAWLNKITDSPNGKRPYHDRPSAWSSGNLPLGTQPASLDDDEGS